MLSIVRVPDLLGYHRWMLNVSGGKDSQLACAIVAEIAGSLGVLDRVVAVHARLPDDWPEADAYAEMHALKYGIGRFEIVERLVQDPETGEKVPQGVVDHALVKGKFPDKARRWCTSDHKRGPCRTMMTRLVREIGPQPDGPVRILNIFGFRAEESADRALHAPFRHDAASSNSLRHVDEWSPIHSWSAKEHTPEVQDYLDATGVPHHPAYDGDDGTPWAGMSRLSCRFCILASTRDLRISARRFPEEAARIIDVEQAIGHTFRPGRSLAQII